MATAVIFPGQGSQRVGMGRDLVKLTDLFNIADKTLGYSLSDIMFSGPDDLLVLTENAQPALLTHSYALWSLIKDRVKVDYFAGHSLGEYTAVLAAGGFSFETAVEAVHNRGKFMQIAAPLGDGGMLAVIGSNNKDIEEACAEASIPNEKVRPANYNAPTQTVVAGDAVALDRFAEIMKRKGAKRIVPLAVSAPFHSYLMEEAQIRMEIYLSNVKINKLSVPIINNVDAKIQTEPEAVKNALARQITGSVKWLQSVEKLIEEGVTKFIEVGSGSVLTGLIKKIDKNVECISVSTAEDTAKL
ncbi:MAG: ACP S-malonyltransferase [Deferribacteraceae bacterium]|jgi:[acyl-carrier-protein] S-malonyltransferase|nr:ACP S-malonyltransferase [Deferribacteraceae bacterium]